MNSWIELASWTWWSDWIKVDNLSTSTEREKWEFSTHISKHWKIRANPPFPTTMGWLPCSLLWWNCDIPPKQLTVSHTQKKDMLNNMNSLSSILVVCENIPSYVYFVSIKLSPFCPVSTKHWHCFHLSSSPRTRSQASLLTATSHEMLTKETPKVWSAKQAQVTQKPPQRIATNPGIGTHNNQSQYTPAKESPRHTTNHPNRIMLTAEGFVRETNRVI